MRNLYSLCLLFALFCTIGYTAKKLTMTSASTVPGARGEVEMAKDKNGNVRLTLKVEHLANPANLTPSANVYVVWLQDKGGAAANQGQLKVDKNLKGTLKAVTPSKSFDIFVTAEQDPSIKAPSGMEVLRATVQP